MIIATRLAALFRRSSAKMLMRPLASLCQGCLFQFYNFHLMSLKRSYHDHVMFKSYAFQQLEVVSQLLWLNSLQFSHDWFCCSFINENSFLLKVFINSSLNFLAYSAAKMVSRVKSFGNQGTNVSGWLHILWLCENFLSKIPFKKLSQVFLSPGHKIKN